MTHNTTRLNRGRKESVPHPHSVKERKGEKRREREETMRTQKHRKQTQKAPHTHCNPNTQLHTHKEKHKHKERTGDDGGERERVVDQARDSEARRARLVSRITGTSSLVVQAFLMKGCAKSSSEVARDDGSVSRHFDIKSLNSSLHR